MRWRRDYRRRRNSPKPSSLQRRELRVFCDGFFLLGTPQPLVVIQALVQACWGEEASM